MSGLPARSFRRSLLTSYLDELRASGLLSQVRAAAGAELGALLDRPGNAGPWLSAAPFDEMNARIADIQGREGVRRLCFEVMRRGFTSVLEPIIHLSLSLLGVSPASLLSRTNLMLAVVSRGVDARWTSAGPSRGTVKISCGEPVPPVSWAAWEGCCLYLLDLGGARGTVNEARPAADGRSCEIDISWAAK